MDQMISVVPSNLVVYHSMNKFAFKRIFFMLETGHQSFYFILFFIIVCLKTKCFVCHRFFGKRKWQRVWRDFFQEDLICWMAFWAGIHHCPHSADQEHGIISDFQFFLQLTGISECALHIFILETISTEITQLCHQYSADAHLCLNWCELMIWEIRVEGKKHTSPDLNTYYQVLHKIQEERKNKEN